MVIIKSVVRKYNTDSLKFCQTVVKFVNRKNLFLKAVLRFTMCTFAD